MATPMMPRPRKPILRSGSWVAAAITVAARLGLPLALTQVDCTTDKGLSGRFLSLDV